MTLGYSKGEVLKTIKQLDLNDLDAEQIIREVLKGYQISWERY